MLRFSLRNLLVNKLRLLLTLAAVTVGVAFVSGHVRALRHHGQGLRRAVRRPDVGHRRGGPGREPPTTRTSPPRAARCVRSTRAWSRRCARSRAWRWPRGRWPASRSSSTRTATRSSPAARPRSAPASTRDRAPRRRGHLPRGSGTRRAPTRWRSTPRPREKAGSALGDHVDVVFQDGRRTFTLVGIVGFGETDSLLGATLAGFDLPTAQRVLGKVGRGRRGRRPGRGRGRRRASCATASPTVLPSGVEALTGEQVAADGTAAVRDAMGIFTTVLLVFAGRLAPGRLLRHLEHLQRAGRAAPARGRAAARSRRDPPPGAGRGARRGRADRPGGRRPRPAARCRPRRRHPLAARS